MDRLLKLSFLFFSLLLSSLNLISDSAVNSLNSGCHNFYDGAVKECFEIWKAIDIVRAIKQTNESRTHFANQILNNFINLYSDISRLSTPVKDSLKDINYIISLLKNIQANFFDVFYDVDSKEFYCICLLIEKIDLLLSNQATS